MKKKRPRDQGMIRGPKCPMREWFPTRAPLREGSGGRATRDVRLYDRWLASEFQSGGTHSQ